VRILLVEDDESNIELLTLRLESLACQVDVVTTADAGLQAARTIQHDVVIVDLMLGLDPSSGIDLVKRLRADPTTATLPIVVHSVFVAYPSEAPEALPSVDGYLPKPFKYEELKRLVASLKLAKSESSS